MSKTEININSTKCCAFCRYWWDPTCSYIAPRINSQWIYEASAKCRCIKKGIDTIAYSQCGLYKCKVEI